MGILITIIKVISILFNILLVVSASFRLGSLKNKVDLYYTFFIGLMAVLTALAILL